MQGGVDNEGNLNARFNNGWTPNNITKSQMQVKQSAPVSNGEALTALQLASSPGGHSMLQLEHDYTGTDYTLNAKALNPSPLDLSGIYILSYLQSVSRNLALGTETIYQPQAGPGPQPQMPEISTSYLVKYTSTAKDWIATAQIQPTGILQATYWQKLGEKVEVAADLQLLATPGRRDAVATVGAKYALRTSTFRAQLDSLGKVSALLEQQFGPTFAFLFSGEIDHFKVRLFLHPDPHRQGC
jgi:mitochondrial import receptor subunit TOM40